MTLTGKCIQCFKRTQAKYQSEFTCRKCKQSIEFAQKTDFLLKLNKFDFGWLTGIIEGEGCFYCKSSISKLKDSVICHPLCGFTLMSTDKDVMERLAELLSLKLNGPYYKKSKKKRKVVWSVQVTGSRAEVIMRVFYEYLSGRRKMQINEALEWKRKGKFVINATNDDNYERERDIIKI